MVNIVATTIPQGSYNFNFGVPFVIPGYSDSIYHDSGIPDTWEVRIVSPEGNVLVKNTSISFPNPNAAMIFFPIISGDLDKAGRYSYQVMKTTSGVMLKSDVGTFNVEASAPPL